jgi:transposase
MLQKPYRDIETYLKDNKQTPKEFNLKTPDHNTIWRTITYLPESYLKELNQHIATFLKKENDCIAVDATGFSTETYGCMRNRKPGTQKAKHHNWLKLHAAVTSVLKAIPSMEVTDANIHDSQKFESLLDSLPLVNIETVTADAAYLSRWNCDLVDAIGAKPYINLKKNVVMLRSKGSKAWFDMVLNYKMNPEAWKKVYHRRSSAESAFSAIKRKFGHKLLSMRKEYQRKELMSKVVAYNLNILAKRRN